MASRWLRTLAPIALVLMLVVAAVLYLYGVSRADDETGLAASGTIEAMEVAVAPELAGRVVEVSADEGVQVNAGDLLFRLDDELPQAQYAQATAAVQVAESTLRVAQATLASAQAQYDIAVQAARAQDMPARTAAWNAPLPEGFSLPAWYFLKSEAVGAAHAELDRATTALSMEQTNLQKTIAEVANGEFVAAEQRLVNAQAGFVVAQAVLDRANAAPDDAALRSNAQKQFDDAQAELDAAQSAYDRMLSTAMATDVRDARARLAVAQARHDAAQDRLNQLLTGEVSLQVAAAAVTVRQAEAQVQQAEATLAQARAGLDLSYIQLQKLAVRASVAGVVLMCNVEPGEVVQPGAVAMTVGAIDRLTLKVYLPEDRYGQINLGDRAEVTVDSFPNQVFAATVVHIADRAEYTPRNVQTAEGRRTTVFAVELSVADEAGRIKPGMPADVRFTP